MLTDDDASSGRNGNDQSVGASRRKAKGRHRSAGAAALAARVGTNRRSGKRVGRRRKPGQAHDERVEAGAARNPPAQGRPDPATDQLAQHEPREMFKVLSGGYGEYGAFRRGLQRAAEAGHRITINRLLLRETLAELPEQIEFAGRWGARLKLYDLLWTPAIADRYREWHVSTEDALNHYVASHHPDALAHTRDRFRKPIDDRLQRVEDVASLDVAHTPSPESREQMSLERRTPIALRRGRRPARP